MALELTAPTSVRAEAPPINREVWNKQGTVVYEFPGTARTLPGLIKLTWYEGEGHLPPARCAGSAGRLQAAGRRLTADREKGSLLIPHVAPPQLLPADKFADFKYEAVPARDHYVSWADACRGEGTATSHFGYSGPLTETVLLGTVAIRVPGEKLAWDAANLKITNSTAANSVLTKSYRAGVGTKVGFVIATTSPRAADVSLGIRMFRGR